jgi:hypothetical protein
VIAVKPRLSRAGQATGRYCYGIARGAGGRVFQPHASQRWVRINDVRADSGPGFCTACYSPCLLTDSRPRRGNRQLSEISWSDADLRPPFASAMLGRDIAGTVAAMTECDPGVLRCNRLAKPRPCVDRDSAPRRERRLAVQCEVGELSFAWRRVRSREAIPALMKSAASALLWLACEVHLA